MTTEQTKRTHQTFTFNLKISVSQNWIDDGVSRDNLKERLKEYIEEEMNGYAYEGEYVAEIE